MTNPTELIAARRREIESEIARLSARINDLKTELPDLDAAERVIRRLSGEGGKPPTGDVDEPKPAAAPTKPANTPTIPAMIATALRNAGGRGLEPKDMTDYIDKRWWPGVSGVAIGPIAWRMMKRGELIKDGPRYKLKPSQMNEATDELSLGGESSAASDQQPQAQGREAGPGGGT